MIYGFDTDDAAAAAGAVLVYAIYRSRDTRRYRGAPDMWGQIERFVKSSAKRARSLPEFVESLKPKVACDTIHPYAMRIGVTGEIPMVDTGTGEYIQPATPEGQREFLTQLFKNVDHRQVVDSLYRETAYIILLVRDRLEREKAVEQRFNTLLKEVRA